MFTLWKNCITSSYHRDMIYSELISCEKKNGSSQENANKIWEITQDKQCNHQTGKT